MIKVLDKISTGYYLFPLHEIKRFCMKKLIGVINIRDLIRDLVVGVAYYEVRA